MSTKPRVHQQLHKYLAFEAPFHKMSQFFFQVCKKDTQNRVSSRFLLCEEEEKPGIEHKSTFTFLWGAVPWGSYSTTAISTTKRFFLLFYSSFSSLLIREKIFPSELKIMNWKRGDAARREEGYFTDANQPSTRKSSLEKLSYRSWNKSGNVRPETVLPWNDLPQNG